jgi:hypothetical protein
MVAARAVSVPLTEALLLGVAVRHVGPRHGHGSLATSDLLESLGRHRIREARFSMIMPIITENARPLGVR